MTQLAKPLTHSISHGASVGEADLLGGATRYPKPAKSPGGERPRDAAPFAHRCAGTTGADQPRGGPEGSARREWRLAAAGFSQKRTTGKTRRQE